jgi:hypothetical protein
VVGLVFLIYGTQKKIWQLDMRGREPAKKASATPEQGYLPAKECTY